MTEPIIVPTPDAVVTPALEKIYELRPSSFQHLNYRTGRYWHPVLAFRSQAALMLQNMAELTKNSRLVTAEGQALREYVESEYTEAPVDERTFAYGEVSFQRVSSTRAGDIPKGTRVNRSPNLNTQVPLKAAAYETLADLHFDKGQLLAGPVAVRAVQAGADSNHPIRYGESIPHGVTVGGLFDSSISVSTFSAAGGSDNVSDPFIRRFAKSFSRGQYGPTSAASVYGAFKGTGVRQVLVFDEPGTGTQKIVIGDSSWASSERWAKMVQQSMYDNDLIGVGCKVVVEGVQNVVVSIDATVLLRDNNYTAETTDVDLAIRQAITEYFDERKDWNVWKTDMLKSVIVGAHSKIYNCTAVTVKNTEGQTLSEISSPNYNQPQYHYLLANGAVNATYSGPNG